jgi:hypothetical protein
MNPLQPTSVRQASRRRFLKAAGTCIALPAFESAIGRAASAAAAPPPKRMIFLGFGWGVTSETWFPDRNQVGRDYALPVGLEPLARHKDRFTVIQGLSNKFSTGAHAGSTFWLTSANQFAEPGQAFHNSVSVDQVAAAEFGVATRFPSLQLTAPDAGESGHGPGLSLAWDQHGKPLAGIDSPTTVFHRLFSADDTPLAARRAAIAGRRSVLDAVREDARRVGRGLSRADARKLDEYLEGLRDIETRLTKEQQWLDVPKATPPLGEPAGGLLGREEIETMYALIVAALQTDATRVITYRQPVARLLTSLDIKAAPHDMSHYTPGERMEASQKRDLAQSELLAGLFDRLAAVEEPDGSSLLDHTCVVYGSNIRTIHYLDNCPTIVAGGGAGIRLGEHAVVPEKTPLANLWLTLLQGSGVRAKSHGDSTGALTELTAYV